MFRIFLTNLGKYNEGELIGEWIDLPVDDDFEEAFEKIGINDQYEEWFITDYENDYGIQVGEYENIYSLNEIADDLNNLDAYDEEIVKALVINGFDIDEAIARVDDVIVYRDCYDMGDVAREYCDECGILNQVPDNLHCYFDFDAFGRDLDIEGCFVYNDGNYYEVLY